MTEHAHEWTENPNQLGTIDAYTCTECGETCATCNVCRKPTGTALLACDSCLDHQGRVLTDIERAVGHYRWAPGSGQLAATRYDRVRVRGTGSDSTGAGISTIGDVAEVLASWAGMWAEALGEEPPASLRGTLDYLRGHIIWAAHHGDVAAWDDYREELRALRHHARRISGLLPQREAAPCVYCGSDVVRDWVDAHWDPLPGGLADEYRCTNRDCGAVWTDDRAWDFTKRHHLPGVPDAQPDALVSFAEIRLLYPSLSEGTFRSWVKRDRDRARRAARNGEHVVRRLPARGSRGGAALYRLGDVASLMFGRAVEDRATVTRGRRAESSGGI